MERSYTQVYYGRNKKERKFTGITYISHSCHLPECFFFFSSKCLFDSDCVLMNMHHTDSTNVGTVLILMALQIFSL